MVKGTKASILILIRKHKIVFAWSLLGLLFFLCAEEATFFYYRKQQVKHFLEGVATFSQTEVVSTNPYEFSRRLAALETIGLLECSRFHEIKPVRRVYYDSSYREGCKSERLKSIDIASVNHSTIWRLEALVAYPNDLGFAQWLARLVVLFFGIFLSWKAIERHEASLITEKERQWFRDQARQVRHDIASPLSALKVVAAYPGLTPSLKDFMQKAIRRAEEICKDLGVVDQGRIIAEPTDVFSLMQEVVREKQSDRLFLRGRRVCALADKSEMARVFSNLLNNSLEAEDSLPIQVEVSESEMYAKVVIVDHGPGFPLPVLQGIKKGLSLNKKGGSGLGLYYAKVITEKYKGKISLSNISTGARVEIQIPKFVGRQSSIHANGTGLAQGQ